MLTEIQMNEAARPKLPPRGFIRGVWIAHRAVHRLTGGRWGLWPTRAGKWGVLRLTTIGRRSGRERVAILGYIEDGRNLVTLAMNGWADPEPAWWLNLQARPEATIRLADGTRAVRAQREWGAGVDGFANLRSRATTVVVFEPASA